MSIQEELQKAEEKVDRALTQLVAFKYTTVILAVGFLGACYLLLSKSGC